MHVTSLKQPTPHKAERLPRCGAKLMSAQIVQWNKDYGRPQPYRCSRKARYRIEGCNLCTYHAGLMLINHHMED